MQIHLFEHREFLDLHVNRRCNKIFKIYIVKIIPGGSFFYHLPRKMQHLNKENPAQSIVSHNCY